MGSPGDRARCPAIRRRRRGRHRDDRSAWCAPGTCPRRDLARAVRDLAARQSRAGALGGAAFGPTRQLHRRTIHPGAALALDDPFLLATLSAACAVAEGALPEREPHPRVFAGLLSLIGQLAGRPDAAIAAFVRWEALLLADLGYGLDLAGCAVTGETVGLAWISPRTGRAVTEAGAGPWKRAPLRLPPFLIGDASDPQDLRDGLRRTGHFRTPRLRPLSSTPARGPANPIRPGRGADR